MADLDPYVARLFQIESGGNPNAVTGSNRGLAQFSPDLEARYGINPANRTDPAVQADAVLREREGHRPQLTSVLGRDPTDADHYLAHQQGLAGASALLTQPDMPAWQAVRKFYKNDRIAQQAITGNIPSDHPLSKSDVNDIRSSDFTSMWRDKFNKGLKGGGPIETAMAGDTTGSLPAQGSRMPSPMDDAQSPGILDRIERGFDPSGTLQNVGAWLMAGANPGGGASMLNAINKDKELRAQRFSLSKDALGRPIVFDQRRGSVQYPQGVDTSNLLDTPEAQKKLADAQAKNSEDLSKALLEGHTSAVESQARAKRMLELINSGKISFGTGADQRTAFKNIPGMDMIFSGGPEGAELQKLMKGAAADWGASQKGMRLMGPEIKFSSEANPTLDKPQETNRQIVTDLIAKYEYPIQANKLAQEYKAKHGYLDAGFQRELAKLRESFPGMAENQFAAPAAGSGLPQGVTSIKVVQ